MSAEVRQELADAVNGVNGITCSPYYRQATSPGSAFVRRDHTSYPNRLGGIVTWQIVVMLPQDLVGAEKKTDELTPLLRAAIGRSLSVTSIGQREFAFPEGTTLPCLFIEGHRESE